LLLVLLEDRLIATDPDCQSSGLGAGRPAAHGGIEQMDAPLGVEPVQPAHQRRSIGREVEVHGALLKPSASPPLPSATASNSGGPGREVNTTSHASATAFGVAAHWAPAARWALAFCRCRSCTMSL